MWEKNSADASREQTLASFSAEQHYYFGVTKGRGGLYKKRKGGCVARGVGWRVEGGGRDRWVIRRSV